jgi:hypothetical protein
VSLKIPQVVVSIDNRNIGLRIVIYFGHLVTSIQCFRAQ